MRNTRWLRYGLASLTVFGAGLSVFVVACGDEDTGATNTSSSSSSSSTTSSSSGQTSSSSSSSSGSSSSSSSSGGIVDAGKDAKAPPVVPAKLQLINAATDFGPAPANASGALRICYKIKSATGTSLFAPLPPLPNRVRKKADGTAAQPFPGVFIGTGGPVDGTGADLSTFEVTPYVFSAGKLEAIGKGSTVVAGGDKQCDELLTQDAGGSLTENVDYWVFPVVPAGQFAQKKSYILMLTGCAGDSTLGAKCGKNAAGTADFTAGPPGLGNLKITKIEVDNTTVPTATSFNAQFVNASPNAEGVLKLTTGGEGVRPAITADPNDAGAAKPLNDGTDLPFLSVTPLKVVADVAFTEKITVNNKGNAGFAFGFATIQALSGRPDAYMNGKAYTFIAVGDPTANPADPAGPSTFNPTGFNLRFLHYLGLPNDPVISNFDPLK